MSCCEEESLVRTERQSHFVQARYNGTAAGRVYGAATGRYYGPALPGVMIWVDPVDVVGSGVTLEPVVAVDIRYRTGDIIGILALAWPWKPKKCQCVQLREWMNRMGPRWTCSKCEHLSKRMAGRWWFVVIPILVTVSLVSICMGDT